MAAMSREEAEQREREFRAKMLQQFPFERIEVDGEKALATWEELRGSGRGVPLIVGDDEAVARLTDGFLAGPTPRPSVAEILATAERLRHPDALRRQRAAEEEAARKSLRETLAAHPERVPLIDGRRPTVDEYLAPQDDRESRLVGEWPSEPSASPGLTVALDWKTGAPLPKVSIALIPTDDPTTIPAHLYWGGWNECPAPEFHVAALRAWRDRYGAELIALTADTLNIAVRRRPETRAEALDLAREQYLYCADIVEQGVGSFSDLAAMLLAEHWWYFWWD